MPMSPRLRVTGALKILLGFLLALEVSNCAHHSTSAKQSEHEPAADASQNASQAEATAGTSANARFEMILLSGGSFSMGNDEMPFEGPVHKVEVKPFWIDVYEVTTGSFAKFVDATGYKTDAERIGWSGVFDIKSGEWK